MKKIGTMLAVIAAATMAVPASAQDGRRDRNPYSEQRRGADTGTVVAVGAAGLILGAVIAGSNNRRSNDRAYDRGYEDGYDRGNYDNYTGYPRSRYEREYLRGGYYYYQGYYYGPRGYYYRDRWYEDDGRGFRRYQNGRDRNYDRRGR